MVNKYLPVIKIHPIILIFIIIAILTGTIMELVLILSIVLFHELGHYFAAKLFDWRIRHIMLWVFGGVMETDEHGSRPLHEEAIVTMAGPFQHIIIYLLIYILSHFNLLPPSLVDIALFYNTIILLFNLLPIWPLDGGKLLFICLCIYKPFRFAHKWVIRISMICSGLFLFLQLFFYPFTLSAFLIMIFIVMENWTEWKQRHYVFIRFLIQRYDGQSSVRKIDKIVVSYNSKLMDIFSQFMWDRKHAIYIVYPTNKRLLIDESDCLRSYFYEKRHNESIGSIVSTLI